MASEVSAIPHVTTAGRDGRTVLLRPVVPTDKDALVDGMHRLSASSRYSRFFSPLSELTEDQVHYFTELDFHDHFAFGAFVDDPEHPGVGVARYIRSQDDPSHAEYAVAVVDEWHGNGVGGLLLDAVLLAAHHNGISACYGDILRTNAPMLALVRRHGATLQAGEPGEFRATFDPAERSDALTGAMWDEVRALVAEVSPPPPGPD
jgi:GNAT superfamily N-acetyltransferase